MKGRKLAALLAMAMALESVSFSAFAEEDINEYESEEYTASIVGINDDSVPNEESESEDPALFTESETSVETEEAIADDFETDIYEDFEEVEDDNAGFDFYGPGNSNDVTGIDAEDYEEIEAGFEVYVNPLYAGIIDEDDLILNADAQEFEEENGYVPLNQSVEITLDGDECLELLQNETMNADSSTVSEYPADLLREGLKARQSSITVMTQSSYSSSLSREIWEEAIAYTGDPQEGDYLRWGFAGWSAAYRIGGGKVRITYNVTYYTTAEQESALTAQVNEVLASLNLEEKSYVEGLKAIYDYICLNVTYDYDSDENYMLKYTAYAAMMNGTAVCQGYSTLFYKMAVQAGYHVRIISGYSNAGEHAWNMVGIDGEYYYADATRDASNAKRGEYYKFLLIGSQTSNYIRDDEYLTEEFVSRYPFSENDYHEVKDAAIIEPSCETPGQMGGGTCIICGQTIGSITEIPALGHQYEEQIVPATLTEDGYCQTKCINCGAIEENEVICHPSEYVMTETGCVFDGKTHPIKLQIFDTEGNEIPSSEYTISYFDKNGVRYGIPYGAAQYRVQITFSGNYSGTHEEYYEITKASQSINAQDLKLTYGDDDLYAPNFTSDTGTAVRLSHTGSSSTVTTDGTRLFLNNVGVAYVYVIAPETENYQEEIVKVKVTVIPKASKITSVQSKKAGTATVNWSYAKGVSGYEIQYSTKAAFGSAKTVKSSNEKTTTAVLTGLSTGTYYVRIRSYQYGGGAIHYSAWSRSSTVKVAAK